MRRNKRTDPEELRASLNTLCQFCGYSIPPKELQRTDFTHVICPKCGKELAPGSAPAEEIRAALQRLQGEKKYFSIAVYRIEGEYGVRIASAGATCGQCDRVDLSTGNIGRVARSGVVHTIDDVSKDASYKNCFSQVRLETVVPIIVSGKTIGVIDAESDSDSIDGTELQDFAKQIERLLARA
jgi:putative methionine-R-sulfoxide reductase with GAF domain